MLKFLGTVTVPATTRTFVARERFVVDIGQRARPKVSYLGENFRNWFLGKIEEPAGEAILGYATLMRSSVDGPILAELKKTAETTLAQVFALLERQPNGERGTLLTDGRANIFYILDVTGALRAVGVYWDGDGWSVGANAVSDPNPWDGGDRVFSRNSSVAQAV